MIQIKAAPGPARYQVAMLKHPLAREVAVVVAIKTALVVAAALFVFGPKQRPVVDPDSVRMLLLVEPAEISLMRGP